MKSILLGQTALAQKVFNVIPITESWSLTEIQRELHRQGSHIERHVIEACISQLVDSKLVKQSGKKPHSYSREAFKEKSQSIESEPKMQKPVSEIKSAPIDPLTKFSVLANQLRQLANAIDDAAIEIEQVRAKEKDQLKALEQLKILLKGVE